MSDQGEALLQAVADAPEDDTPRLVYADWLDEHGDTARAEFIRVQIARTRLPADDDRQAELAAREKELGDRNYCSWLPKMPPGILSRPFVRGFPESVGLSESVGFSRSVCQRYQLSRDDLASLTEAMETLPIRTFQSPLLGCRGEHGGICDDRERREAFPAEGESGLELLAQWPLLHRVTTLDVGEATGSPGWGDFTPGLRALAQSPYAGGITDLGLDSRSFHQSVVGVLGKSDRLSSLTGLRLRCSDGPVVQTALAWLWNTALGARLQRLDCFGTPVPSRLIRAVLDQGALTHLQFTLCSEGEAEGVGPLLGAPKLAALRRLDLARERDIMFLDDWLDPASIRQVPGLRELLSSPLLAGLEELSLACIDLGHEGARAVADSPCARNLIKLRLDLCNLTGAELRTLRPVLSEGRLRRLSLGDNPLINADAAELASWPEFGRLHELELGGITYLDLNETVGGRAALLGSPHRHRFLRLS
jgi:uncharacterized protein (TIGR02996 family)